MDSSKYDVEVTNVNEDTFNIMIADETNKINYNGIPDCDVDRYIEVGKEELREIENSTNGITRDINDIGIKLCSPYRDNEPSLITYRWFYILIKHLIYNAKGSTISIPLMVKDRLSDTDEILVNLSILDNSLHTTYYSGGDCPLIGEHWEIVKTLSAIVNDSFGGNKYSVTLLDKDSGVEYMDRIYRDDIDDDTVVIMDSLINDIGIKGDSVLIH